MADVRQFPQKNKRVRVYVRTRPTPYFAHDKLELLPDNKVTSGLKQDHITCIRLGGMCSLFSQ